MTDLEDRLETAGRSTRRISSRVLVLLALGLAVLLVAVLASVLVRGVAGSGGDRVVGGGSGGGTAAPDPSPAASPTPRVSAGSETSAATLRGWGEPAAVEEFDGPLGREWEVYDGEGHDGNGRRSPDAVSIADGVMTLTGDPKGKTAGLALRPGHKYGRWEGRVRAPASDDTYNALMLLWPDKEDWPVGGEVDFMEMDDPTRQTTKMYLHYGEDNDQDKGQVRIDATQWHNWAVEWTADHIICFVDGKEWYRTTDRSILPPRSMHLTIQLDWLPKNGDRDKVKESTMQVDWVKEYPPPGR